MPQYCAPSRLTEAARRALPVRVQRKNRYSARAAASEGHDEQRLRRDVDAGQFQARLADGRHGARIGAPQQQRERMHDHGHAHADDHQHDRGVGRVGLDRQPVDDGAERGHQRQRGQHLQQRRGHAPGQRRQRGQRRARRQVGRQRAQQRAAVGSRPQQVQQQAGGAARRHYVDHGRQRAFDEAGQRQRAEGHVLALRDVDHARGGVDQHQAQADQRVHRAVGQAVRRQEQGSGEIHPYSPSSSNLPSLTVTRKVLRRSRPRWSVGL